MVYSGKFSNGIIFFKALSKETNPNSKNTDNTDGDVFRRMVNFRGLLK